MPGLFSTIIKNANDAVEYHAEYMEDARAGRRDKYGRKTDLWYEEEDKRRRRHKHGRHRRHRRGSGERRERSAPEGENAPAEAPPEEGGQPQPPTEGSAADQAAQPNPEGEAAAPQYGHGHRRHHRRHRSRSRSRSHRRHHRATNADANADTEILEPPQGPLGRELPPDTPRSERSRPSSGWVDKRTGRSVSPPRIEMRPWLKKLLKRPPYHKENVRGTQPPPPMMSGALNDGRQTGASSRRKSVPGHPYIDDEEAEDGPRGEAKSLVDGDAAPPYSETEEGHAAGGERREGVEGDARGMEEGGAAAAEPVQHVEEPPSASVERSEVPASAAEPPAAVLDPGESAPIAAAGHQAEHRDTRADSHGSVRDSRTSCVSPMPSDDESDGSVSGASTRATTAPSNDKPKKGRAVVKGLAGERHEADDEDEEDEDDGDDSDSPSSSSKPAPATALKDAAKSLEPTVKKAVGGVPRDEDDEDGSDSPGSSSKAPATTIKDAAKSLEPTVKKAAGGILKDDDEESGSPSKTPKEGLKEAAKSALKGAAGALLKDNEEDESGPSTAGGRKNKRNNKKSGMRGGGSGSDDDDMSEVSSSYEMYEEYDRDYEERDRESRRQRDPRREQEPTSQAHHAYAFPPPPSMGQRANPPASPFGRQPRGQRMDHDDPPSYQPQTRARAYGAPPRGYAAGPSTAFKFSSARPAPRIYQAGGKPADNDRWRGATAGFPSPFTGEQSYFFYIPPRARKPRRVDSDDISVDSSRSEAESSDSSDSDSKVRLDKTCSGKSRRRQSRHQKAAPPAKPEDYYAILGVSPDIPNEEMRRAAIKMRAKVHPDKNLVHATTEEEKAKVNERAATVGQAAEILCHPVKRDDYDAEVRDWERRYESGGRRRR